MTSPAQPAWALARRYHPHIDGLRAIAVVAVVASHLGIPWLAGGFVGVDIFFVISGYLIIGQIIDDRLAGSFRFGDFWSRRALRILPPLLVVLLVSSAVGVWVSVLPEQFHTMGQEGLYAALMAVNLLLASQQSYFDALAGPEPFLHLWSLGVEEQFYIVAPILIALALLVVKRRPRMAALAVAVLFGASLAASIAYSEHRSFTAFYMASTRAWEFIAGGAIAPAVGLVKRLPRAAIELLGWLGLAALATAIAWVSPDADYPSYAALLPVAGAAVTIAAGLAVPEGKLARLLALRPLVVIGLWSYAWYLWHWPAIVFIREMFFGAPPPAALGAAALLSLGLAALTHRVVEVPVRNWRRGQGKLLGWRPALLGTAFMLAVGVGLIGLGEQLAAQTRLTTPPFLDFSAEANASACRIDGAAVPTRCVESLGGRRLGLLIGDSHAQASFSALSAAAEADGARLGIVGAGACPPVTALPDNEGPCGRLRRGVDRLLASDPTPIAFAVLVSYWQLYVGDGALIEGRPRVPLGRLDPQSGIADAHAVFVAGLRASIAALQQHGVGKILVLGPTPNFADAARDCVVRAKRNGGDPGEICTLPRDVAETQYRTALDWLREALSGLSGVRLADPRPAFCDADRCRQTDGGTLLFYDNDHPTAAGEAAILKLLAGDLDWVFSP